MKAAQISDTKQVKEAKIQLKDVTKIWLLPKKVRLEKPITWDQFSKSFYERFFPLTAQKEMKK